MRQHHSRIAALVTALLVATAPALAQKRYDPGVSDTEIKFGQTMPYSGPASAFSTVGKSMTAWFAKVNAEGGIGGRKINLISLDDGYSPPKTVEHTRRLVDQDGVLAIYGTLGAPTNSAIQRYLNGKKVPQLLITTASSHFDDPKTFPWTIAVNPSPAIEAAIYAKHILTNHPQARIAVLYQNDDFGKDYLKGLEQALGANAEKMIAGRQSYEVTDPTVDSQIVALKASGADVLMTFATPKFAALTIRKTFDMNWKPLHILANPAATVGQVLVPAGLEKSVGLITAAFTKDPTDPQWENDAEMKAWKSWMQQYYPEGNRTDYYNVFGYVSAQLLSEVVRRSGDNLTRENLMKQATSLTALKVPMLLPGITITTSPTDYALVEQMQLARFDGKNWVLFGSLIGR